MPQKADWDRSEKGMTPVQTRFETGDASETRQGNEAGDAAERTRSGGVRGRVRTRRVREASEWTPVNPTARERVSFTAVASDAFTLGRI